MMRIAVLWLMMAIGLVCGQFNVNMDIDIETGDYMVNTQSVYKFSVFTSKVTAGTKVQVKVPFQLQVMNALPGQAIASCKEAAFTAATNTMVTNVLTNCLYQEYVGYSAIEFTISQSYNDITLYYFYMGPIRNPSSVLYPDSFEISFTQGYPTGTQMNGLTLTYVPNLIYSASLTHTLVQAGTVDTYTFKFKITNNIPRYGYLKLKFPLPWLSAPQTIQSLTKSINIYGYEKTGFTVLTPITQDVVYSGLFDLSGLTAGSGDAHFITITIAGVQNPNSITTSESFQITTLDDAKNEIDKLTTGLVIAITEPGTIEVSSMIVGDRTVDTATYIQIDMHPSARYASGGYFEIVCPSPYIQLTSTIVCNTVFGLTGTATCTRISDTIIRYKRDISSMGQISISLFQFTNTLGVLELPSFEIYLKEANGNVVAQNKQGISYKTEAGKCTVISAVRGGTVLQVGLTGAQYSLTIQCDHRIPGGSAGSVQIVIPEEQMAYSSSMTCQTSTGKNLNCQVASIIKNTLPYTTVTIQANQWCSNADTGCLAKEQISVTFLNAKNPPSIIPLTNLSLEIYTQNSLTPTQTLIIDQLVTGVYFTNNLLPGALSEATMSRVGGSVLTGGSNKYQFTLKTMSAIPIGGSVKVTFPSDTAYLLVASNLPICMFDNTRIVSCTYKTTTDLQIESITLSNACTNGCISGTTLNIAISNILNPFSTKSNSNLTYKLETFKDTGLIDILTFTGTELILQPNTISVTLQSPTSPIIVGAINTYKLLLQNTYNRIPSINGRLEIIMPTDVLLVTGGTCTAQTSTFSLICTITDQKVTITSIIDIAKNSQITVTLTNNVRNPQTGSQSQAFMITSYFSNALIDTNSVLKVQADTFNDIINPTSTRENVQINTATKITFGFQTTNPIPVGAQIKISIPTDQLVVDSSNTLTVSSNGISIVVKSQITTANGYNTFTIIEWCSISNIACASLTQYTFEITKGFKNPNTARYPSNSIKLEIYASNGLDKVDSVSSNLITIPSVTYGFLQSVSITKSIDIVGQPTKLTIQFKTSATTGDLPNNQGYVNVFFPSGFLYNHNNKATVICTVKDVSTTCSPTYATDSLGQQSLQKIVADLKCTSTNPCSGGNTYTFTIDGLTNSYSTHPNNGQIISTSVTQQSILNTNNYEIRNVLDQLIGTDLIFTVTPGSPILSQIVRNPATVDSETVISLSVTTATRIYKGTTLLIKLPISQFVENNNLKSYTVNGLSSSTFQIISTDADYYSIAISDICKTSICLEKTIFNIALTSGFSNIGYVNTAAVTQLLVQVYTMNGLYAIDKILNVGITPNLEKANIVMHDISMNIYEAAKTSVELQISMQFNARVYPGNYLTMQFTSEYIRNDNGLITCSMIISQVEVEKPCEITQLSPNIIGQIKILDPCSTLPCDATSTYIVKIKNLVNKLNSSPFQGNLIIEARIDDTSIIGQLTKSLKNDVPQLIPGQLQNIAVTRSFNIQGQNSDFLITFKTPGYLLIDSIIEIWLPLNQITPAKSTYKILSDNFDLGFTQQTSDSTTHLVYSGKDWRCKTIDVKCNSGITYSIQIQDSVNPFIQSTVYSDFIIYIKQATNELIFQSPSPLIAQPQLQFGIIDSINVIHQNSQFINRQTEYVFTFPVQSSIPMGGKLRITFPLKRVFTTGSVLTCKVNDVIKSCTSNIATSNNIVITNICQSSICVGPQTYSILLSGGMKNPSTVQSITGNFIVETLSSGDFIVNQGLLDNLQVTQVLPEPLMQISITRASSSMSAQTDYKLSFQIVNQLLSSGFYRVIIPIDQAIVPSNGPTCKVDISMVTLGCRVVYKTNTDIWVDIQSTCSISGCAAGTIINILLQGMTNPSYFSANTVISSWQVYTMNVQKEYIDGTFTNVKAKPDLIGKTSLIQAISLEENFVGRNTVLKIGIIPGIDMTNDAMFDIYFPDQFATKRTDNPACVILIGTKIPTSCEYTTYSASSYIYKVSIRTACPLSCQAQSIYYYDIPLQNRLDNLKIAGNFKILVRYPLIDVGQGSLTNPLSIQPEMLNKYYVTSRGNNIIDQEAMLYLSFKPINTIPKDSKKGRIRVIIPSQIKILTPQCIFQVDGSYPQNAQCKITDQTAIVTHSIDNLVGKNLTLEFRKIANPGSTKPSDPIKIYTEWDVSGNSGVYSQIDQNIADITYQATGVAQLWDATITRLPLNDIKSGYLTGQTTQLWVQINLRHQLDSTSSILVEFPKSAQVSLLPTADGASSCYSTDQGGRHLNMLLCELNKTSNRILVRNYCQVSSCGKRDDVRFKLMETFVRNFNYIVDPLNPVTDAIKVTTTTRENIYYYDTASVIIEPDLLPTSMIMPSPEIIRTNNIINKRVSWVFSFKTNKNIVPRRGYLSVTFPKDVLLTVPNSTLDIFNYDNNGRYWNTSVKFHNTTKSQQSISEIIVWNLCNSTDDTGCQVGSSFSFMIDWIKNPVSQITVTQSIILDMKTPEGYIVERGTTQPVINLFSELIPVRLQNLQIRPIDPSRGVKTDYEIIFSADAEFSVNDAIMLTLPVEMSFINTTTTSIKRDLQTQSQQRCLSIFDKSTKITCTQLSPQKLKILGLFNTLQKSQFGVKILNILNPLLSGPTSALIIEVVNQANQTIASRSTLSRVDILEPMNQTLCNKVCGSCAGTNSTCTSCVIPSKYPLYKDYQCVDSCGSGYYFDQSNLRCIQCDTSCTECFGPGANSCTSCSQDYFLQDGVCQSFCTKSLKASNNQCLSSYTERCNSQCLTCSMNPDYCLSCDKNSPYPVYDSTTGRCIQNNQSLCGKGLPQIEGRMFIEQNTMECQLCNELCHSCEETATKCTSCWQPNNTTAVATQFQSRQFVNELYETCVDRCGLGTYYDQGNNTCRYCNPVCLSCSGQRPDQCLVCNRTPEAKQLYLINKKQCVIECPKEYKTNVLTNECYEQEVEVLSFSFLFLFSSCFLGSFLVLGSAAVSRCKNKSVDVVYSVTSIVECVSRLCLLGNLFVKSQLTGVFPLSVCFMNIIATSSLGLFFNLLFMTPIYAHSPKYRQQYRVQNRKTALAVEWLSYFAGVNVMRLLCSGFFGLQAFHSDLNLWEFYSIPLNMISNYTLLFSFVQLCLDTFIVLYLSVSDDAFTLAAMGLGLNTLLMIMQLFKHLTTVRQFSKKDTVIQEQQ